MISTLNHREDEMRLSEQIVKTMDEGQRRLAGLPEKKAGTPLKTKQGSQKIFAVPKEG